MIHYREVILTRGDWVTAGVSHKDLRSKKDEVLAELFVGGDHSAFAELANRYLWLIRSIASGYKISGLDSDDLIQEGMLGLLYAAKTYSPDKGAKLQTYVSLCIRRRIIALLEHSVTNKSKSMNNYVSLEQTDREIPLNPESDNINPEDMIISYESLSEIHKRINDSLSKKEKSVFDLYIAGETYQSIGQALSMSVKSVDNALQRIRRKLRKQFSDIPL